MMCRVHLAARGITGMIQVVENYRSANRYVREHVVQIPPGTYQRVIAIDRNEIKATLGHLNIESTGKEIRQQLVTIPVEERDLRSVFRADNLLNLVPDSHRVTLGPGIVANPDIACKGTDVWADVKDLTQRPTAPDSDFQVVIRLER